VPRIWWNGLLLGSGSFPNSDGRRAYGRGVQRRRQPAAGLGLGLTIAVLAACGTSSATTTSPSLSSSPAATSPAPSVTPTPSPSPGASVTAQAGVPKKGAASATCVNGWTEPASSSDDFWKQAVAALQQNQGGTGYTVKSVRYFAGPLASGGIGAIYYLKLSGSGFAGRVLLVSGGGAAQAAAAPFATTGWKAGDWKGFRGQTAAAAYPGLPGKWSGPEYDAVTGGLLSASVAGCMQGT
jgi:hypothetical protein